MATRKPLVGGNWKCNGTVSTVSNLVELLNNAAVNFSKVDVVVAPTALHVPLVKASLKPDIQVSVQNMSKTNNGAFTGEISAEMVKEFGLTWCIIGHSERRQLYGETDEDVRIKIAQALGHGLSVIACIGETLAERERNETMSVLYRQLAAVEAISSSLGPDANLVIAYEPVWAIGTGKVASPAQAQEAHFEIRKWLSENVSPARAQQARILYGGSVNAANCAELIRQPDIDGFLVGGASLKPEFIDILQAAANKQ
eukprot:GILJ01001442.1.p1 GENE.GILJ01001442.1~~GILJ01001442.1.p1  ORF type:complete len:256 (-),score=40.72 GILJ01001442.1:139-906(-)